MKNSSILFIVAFLIGSLSSANNKNTIVCEHKDLNLKVIVQNIQPFSIGNNGRLVDLTSADLVFVHDGLTETIGALGPRNENLESFYSDNGTGIEFSTDALGRVTAKLNSQKFKLRASTATGLVCEDHRDPATQRWMKQPSDSSLSNDRNGVK